MAGDTSVDMMLNVLPGTMTGFFALNAGLSSINQIFQNMTKSVDNHFGILEASIVSATALLGQLSVNAASSFGEYEQGMKIVQAVSGQTSATVAELGNQINDFSVKYRMDIDELTTGLQTLGRAGLKSAQEQTEVLENGLQTAKLEGRDLNSILQEIIQNTTLLGGNLKSSNFGEQTQYVNDLLVATSMTAPINTHDISETLKYSGGMLAAGGGTIVDESGQVDQEGRELIEDYMGTVAAFAQKGVTGSIAGTALRAFFNKPATQDTSVTDALASIHLKPEYLWEEGEEQMKPVSEQIGIIQSQMDKLGVSQMDRLQIWSKIVGGKMGQQMIKLDSSDIKEVTKDIREANSAEKLATQSMQTYQSAVKQTGEAGARAMRAYGEHVARFLTPLAKTLTPILNAMANPLVSTTAFTLFIALIGRAAGAVRKIFTGIRGEIGMIKASMKSLVLNQPTRRALVGNNLWGGIGLREQEQAYNQMSMKMNEVNLKTQEASTTSVVASREVSNSLNQIFARVDHIGNIVTATNNRIKEVLIEINGKLSSGITTYSQRINTAVSNTATRMKTEFDNASTQVSNSFKGKMDKNIASSAAKMKTEFQAALNSITYNPKIKQTGAGAVGSIISEKRNADSKSYMFMGNIQKRMLAVEDHYQKQLTDLEKSRSHVMLSRQVKSEMGSSQKKTGQLIKQEIGLKEELDKVAKSIARQDAIIENATNQLKNGQARYNLEKRNEARETKQSAIIEKARLLEKKELLEEELRFKHREVNLHRGIVRQLDQLLAQIEAERLSLLRGKGSTVSNSHAMPGMFKGYQDIPEEYRPNYSISMPIYSRWNLPPGYGPKTGASTEQWSNHRVEQRKAILAQREANQALLKKQRADIINANAVDKYTKRLNSSFSSPKVGAALNRFFGGSYTESDLFKAQTANMAVNPTSLTWTNKVPIKSWVTEATKSGYRAAEQESAKGQSKVGSGRFPVPIGGVNGYIENGVNEITVEALKQLNLVLREHQMVLEELIAVERIQGGRARTTPSQVFSTQALAQKESQHLNEQLKKIDQQGHYMGYAHMGYGSNSSAKEALNWARYQQRDKPVYNYSKMTPVLESTNKEMVVQQNALKQLLGEKLDKQEKNALKQHSMMAQQNTYLAKQDPESVTKPILKTSSQSSFSKMSQGVTQRIKGFGSGLRKVTNFMGGPFFAGLMAIDIAMQVWNHFYQDFAKKVEEATQKLDDAIQKQSEAESVFFEGQHKEGEKEITGWNEENPDATSEEKEDALLGAYSDIYDNSSQGITALEENTQQLAIATQEVKIAGDKVGARYLDESIFSGNGMFGRADANQIATGNMGWDMFTGVNESFRDKYGNTETYVGKDYFSMGEIKISGKQQEETYPWLKEFAPIIAADVWATGSTEKALRGALGNAGFEKLNDQLSSTGGWDNSAWTRHGYNVANYFGDDQSQNRLQMGLKNYQKDFKKLAQQSRRFEKATGATPMKALNSRLAQGKNMKQALKDLSVQDPKLVNYIKSLAIKTGMTEQQVLMAAQLQQLQDMQQIAENQVSPQLMSLVSSSYDQVAYSGQISGMVNGSGEGAISAAQNAAAIAALLQVKVETELGKKAYDEYMKNIDPRKGEAKYKTQEELMSAAQHAHDDKVAGKLDPKDEYLLKYYDHYMKSYAEVNTKLFNPNVSPEYANEQGDKFLKEAERNNATSSAMYDTLRKGLNTGAQRQILSAYDAQLNDEEGEGSGGGGGGSGSGSDKGNDNTGTKKERVDLVLCNKKEIPKLNVNLFKKPPSFTILNKNFKLRDVRINSEDKPKAIMAAIKNSFIDIQKRTDPKIIQDEEAVYDPNAATDGTNLPSGSAKTRTDS